MSSTDHYINIQLVQFISSSIIVKCLIIVCLLFIEFFFEIALCICNVAAFYVMQIKLKCVVLVVSNGAPAFK